MTYADPTPTIGLILPVPNTGQAFETTNVNANFTRVDTAFKADRDRLGTIEGKIDDNAVVPAGPAAARDALYGIPSGAVAQKALQDTGARWFNTATQQQEQYWAAYNVTTNPRGFNQAGWFAVLNSGWNLIKPVSAVGTGVTVNADGSITCVATPALSVNGCFWPGLFDDYVIVANLKGTPASNPSLQLRAAGVDAVGASTYLSQLLFAHGTSAVAALASTKWTLGATLALTVAHVEAHVASPSLAAPTMVSAVMEGISATDSIHNTMGGGHISSVAYDGFTFTGANLDGTFRVYGIAKGA